MKKNLAKRLIFFGNLILVLGFLSFVFLLQKLDSHYLNQDVLDLSLLYSLKEFDEKDINYISIFENTNILIHKNNMDLYKSKQNLRQEIYKWLLENGMDMQGLLGKMGPSHDVRPYIFFEYDINSIKKSKIQKTRKEYVVTQTVDYYIKKLNILASPGEITIAYSKINNLPNEIFKLGSVKAKLHNVYLHKNNLEIRYSICPPGSQTGCPESMLEIPVKTKIIKRPSILYITDEHRPQNQALEELYNSNRKSRLNNLYGHLRLEEARRIATDMLTKTYKSIEILGFEFSTQKFPFALLFLFSICLIGTLFTLIKARKYSLLIITEVEDDSPVKILIDHIVTRILLWIILPAISVIISFPITPLPVLQIMILWFGASVLILLGVLSISIAMEL